MILSILIPTLYERAEKFRKLKAHLEKQIENVRDKVEILVNVDNREKTTGQKRNELLQEAKGEYVVFVDDDDWVPDYYISEIMEAAKEGRDCMAINGIYTENGGVPIRWEIAIDNPYADVNGVYKRYPNHITPIKREKILQFKFPDRTLGEDYDWATRVHNSRVLRTQTVIDRPMYEYHYISNK
jgi:glycosyltransferase involved in cell wall biosynthesis